MKFARSFLVVLSAFILSACGGGGSEGEPTDRDSDAIVKFEGMFEGTVDARQNWFRILVLPDGEAWITYGDRRNDGPKDLGYAKGAISQTGNVIKSVGIVDYGRAAGAPLQFDGAINSQGEVTGTLIGLAINSGNPAAFVLNEVVEGYEFARAPTFPDPANTVFENEDGSIRTSQTEVFTFGLLGCVSPGILTPHESGKNLYSVGITLESRDCPTIGLEIPGTVLNGIVYFIELGAGKKEMNLFLNESEGGADDIEIYLRFRTESKAG